MSPHPNWHQLKTNASKFESWKPEWWDVEPKHDGNAIESWLYWHLTEDIPAVEKWFDALERLKRRDVIAAP